MPQTPPTTPLERTPLKKPSLYHRQSSTLRYHTFPTAPPRNAGPPQPQQRQIGTMKAPSIEEEPSSSHSRHSSSSSRPPNHKDKETPLPKSQLLLSKGLKKPSRQKLPHLLRPLRNQLLNQPLNWPSQPKQLLPLKSQLPLLKTKLSKKLQLKQNLPLQAPNRRKRLRT